MRVFGSGGWSEWGGSLRARESSSRNDQEKGEPPPGAVASRGRSPCQSGSLSVGLAAPQ